MEQGQTHVIRVEQLCIGLYVHLDLGWMSHPFLFSNFKIESEEQLDEIRKIGLRKLRYDPLRSDCDPLPKVVPEATKGTEGTAFPSGHESTATQQEKHRFQIRRLKQLHQTINECERKFVVAANMVRHVLQNVQTQPKQQLETTEKLVGSMVESVLTERDIVLYAINGETAREENHVHSLNVTVLSLMLAKHLDISSAEALHLGMGAIFHDIGKFGMPDTVLNKSGAPTKEEQMLLEQHPVIGARMVREFGLPEQIADIILQHHEFVDGSGYPQQLRESQIMLLARVLSIINTYDNLCNPADFAVAMSPYEALSTLFTTQSHKFDAFVLRLLIKCLGVYPAGSIVQLSSGEYGMVVSVNPNKPLRPFVMLHAPYLSVKEPLIIDLSDELDANIAKCLRATQLPEDAYAYLNPHRCIHYFFDKDLPADE